MKGGKMINKGEYGCIYDPPLICRGEKEPRGGWKTRRIGKLTEISDVKGEIMAAEIFSKKPGSRKYLILPILNTLCKKGPNGEPALVESEQTERDFNNCSALDRFGWKNMVHYQLDYGGTSISQLFSDDVKLQTAMNDRFSYVKFMEQLLEIGAYLCINGFIHNDLHVGNILLNKQFFPRLIDYGRAYYKNITTTTLEEVGGMVYDAELGQITPEMTAQDGLNSDVEYSVIINDLKNKKPGFKYIEQLFNISCEEQASDFNNFWKTSKCVQQKDWLQFWKLYWPLIDSYAIGYDLIRMMVKMKSLSGWETSAWNEKKDTIQKILIGLLKGSPRDRLDCVEALALYNPNNVIIVNISGKTWLEKRKAQREMLEK